METISIKDFAKIDLRVATIINVEDIEGADKLYKITLDLGNEKRTVAAGLKKYYNKGDLIGKQVIVVYNLEPKMLKGIKSQGMLLAAQDGNKVALLKPDKQVANGSKVF